MNNYAITLNDEVSSYFIPWEFSDERYKHTEIAIVSQDLNLKFTNFLLKYDLIVNSGRIFHVGPNTKYYIHTDWVIVKNIAKLNFVLNGKESYMIWYKEKIGKKILPFKDNLGHITFRWLEEDVEEIHRTHIEKNKLTLVNVGIPHTLVNPIEFRTCYSMFLSDSRTRKHVVFDDAKERLKDYLILPQ